MKKKIVIIDSITEKGRKTEGGLRIEHEVNVRNYDHVLARQKYKSSVFVDRKKRAKSGYVKHKGKSDET